MCSYQSKVIGALMLIGVLLVSGNLGNVHAAFPAGWGGGGGTDYELGVDGTVKHGGNASGFIKSTATEPTWYGAFTQAIKADDFRGKRLRLTAYVKSKDVENSASLWMRIEAIDGKGNYLPVRRGPTNQGHDRLEAV